MAAVVLEKDASTQENLNTPKVIKLNRVNECRTCEGFASCEYAHLGNRACVTMPELFVSQR